MSTRTGLPVKQSVTLADGTVVGVRPIMPGDAEALVDFHQRLSERAVFLRYFYSHLRLGADEVAHLTRVDGRDRMALVVEHCSRMIAVGRYERLDNLAQAEVAFVVADEFQHHGIGTLLLDRLAAAAREVGVTEFIAAVLAENTPMLAVFRASGFPAEWNHQSGEVEVKMSIGPPGGVEDIVQAGTLQTS
jgi:GNAT superfamily N-acetyltransferase